jgi:hypothetical protein
MRVQHDYKRRGALARLAAWDVRRGQVTGRCEHTTGITPFSRLARQVMTAEPYASANRVAARRKLALSYLQRHCIS